MDKSLRTALIIGIIVLVAVLVVVPLVWGGFSGWRGGWGMMGPGMMGFGGFGMLMMIPMVLFWGLVVWGIVWLVRGAGCCATSHIHGTDSAMDILRSRYARGEITRDEFEASKRDLS